MTWDVLKAKTQLPVWPPLSSHWPLVTHYAEQFISPELSTSLHPIALLRTLSLAMPPSGGQWLPWVGKGIPSTYLD